MTTLDVESISLAGAFLLGALLATIATLRVMRAVTIYLTGVERRLEHDRDAKHDREHDRE